MSFVMQRVDFVRDARGGGGVKSRVSDSQLQIISENVGRPASGCREPV
jgi:hypothetical protein